MFAFLFRSWRRLTSTICVWMFIFTMGHNMHAQLGERNVTSRHRRPAVPGPNTAQRQFSGRAVPDSYLGRNVPRTQNARTSPRLHQFRTMQKFRAKQNTASASDQAKRPSLPRRRLFSPRSVSTTGLNPKQTVAPDTRLNPRLRFPRSPLRRHEDRGGEEQADRLAPSLFDHSRKSQFDFGDSEKELAVRRWKDNTGTFSTVGRLVAVIDSQVLLLKENGRTTTVPLRRLSKEDQQYVENQLVLANDDPS